MQTIKNNTSNEIIIKNSRFICYLYKIKDINEANLILNNLLFAMCLVTNKNEF